MRRCMVVVLALVLAACSSDLTAPRDIPEPHSAVGSAQMDSYTSAPCAGAITSEIALWTPELGEPTAIVAGTAGDTSYVRVEFVSPPGYWQHYYGGRVWQEWYWLPAWGYCMAVRSVGMPNPYE